MSTRRHLIISEDLRLVHAGIYGLERSSVTMCEALTAIGSWRCLLALLPTRAVNDCTPDPALALWTFDDDVILPEHVTLLVAPAVTVLGAGLLHVTGTLITYRADWYQGTGQWRCDGRFVPL